MKSTGFWIGLFVGVIVVLGAAWLAVGGLDYLRVERLVAQLGSPTVQGNRGQPVRSDDQTAAYEALVAMGDKAVPALQRGLRAKNEWQRGLSAKALGQIRDPNAAEELRRVMHADSDPGVRMEAAHSLRLVAGAEAVPDLIQALTDPESGVRANAAEELGELRAAEAISSLAKLLGDSGPRGLHSMGSVSDEARRALVKIGAPAVPSLLKTSQTSEWLARCFAIEALGEIGDPQARPQLRQLLKDPDRDIRGNAAEALSRMERSMHK